MTSAFFLIFSEPSLNKKVQSDRGHNDFFKVENIGRNKVKKAHTLFICIIVLLKNI